MEKSEPIGDIENKVLLSLDKLSVPYVRLTHPAASTMELCDGIGHEYGARHCKNLFLANRQGDQFYLILMEPEALFRTADISKKLGVARLSFGNALQLKNVLDLEQGSVSIMGLVNDCARSMFAAKRLHIVIDRRIAESPMLCVHPNVNTASLVLRVTDILRFISQCGYEYKLLDI